MSSEGLSERGAYVMPGKYRGRPDRPLLFNPPCEDHAYLTTSEREPNEQYGSGFRQSARCVVCGYETGKVDASWWDEPLTDEQAAKAVELMEVRLDGMASILAALREHKVAHGGGEHR